MKPEESDTLWYPSKLDVFLNHWFSNYEDARHARAGEGGYLLPYRHQFFVCQAEAIRVMGLDPCDPDWEKIGFDAARPVDEEAYARLRERREQAEADELSRRDS